MKEFDIIIIGGGAAGLTSAVYCARSNAKTLVIEKEICGGQIMGTSEIENMPGFAKIGGAELAMEMTTQAEVSGAEITYETVESVDLVAKTIKTSEGEYSAKAIIVATGAGPRKLRATNADVFDGKGIHYCALCDGAFYKDKDVVVVGGGNSAVEEVIYLSDIAKSVSIVNVTEKFNAHESLVDKMRTLPNFAGEHHQSTVDEVLGEDGKISGVIVKHTNGEKRTVACHGIFVAIGREPNTKLFGGVLDLNDWGYIRVSPKMETNIAGVFAAGDVVDKQIRQVVTACADGAIAATNAWAWVKKLS